MFKHPHGWSDDGMEVRMVCVCAILTQHAFTYMLIDDDDDNNNNRSFVCMEDSLPVSTHLTRFE